MSRRPVVFVAWDSELGAAGQTFADLADEDGPVDVEIVGACDDVAVGRLAARLEDAVARGAAVIAVVDQPNANMAWELGMALAKGLPMAFATEHADAEAHWLESTPLGGVLRAGDICENAEALLGRIGDFEKAPTRPLRGERKVVVCSSHGSGKQRHKRIADVLVAEGWELLDVRGWHIGQLAELLEDAGRVAWVQQALRKGDARHGVDNTVGALVAGYAHALGVPVAAFVDGHCPRPLDARELEREHGGRASQLVEAIRDWSTELDKPAPVRTRRLRDRYADAMKARHGNPLAYVERLGLTVAELQPVDVEVDVGGPVDGLECRVRGFADRRHGTLDRLVQEDLAAGGPVRWLVVAEPGAGKTTLLRRIAHDLATKGKLPVFVPLARWAQGGGDPIDVGVLDGLGPTGAKDGPRIARMVRSGASERGRVWLLLDGFDEVKQHGAVRRSIEALARTEQWQDTPIIVTCRQSAAEGDPSSDDPAAPWADFTRAALRLLDEPQQRTLVSGLLGEDAARVGAFWTDIADRPGVGVLLPNPFLLTLTVGLFTRARSSGATVPVNRRSLLQLAVSDCLERGWAHDPEEDAPEDRWSPRWARRVLRGLSLELHRRGGESWTEEVLAEVLATLPRLYPGLGDLFGRDGHWRSDRVFLDDVGHYGGLVGPLDGPLGDWRYLHRSLREVLAAECLAQEVDAARRAEVVAELMEVPEDGAGSEDDGPGRSAEVLALLAGMVPEDEAFGHLEALAAAAPQAGIRALGSVEGLDPVRWLGVLLEMAPEREGRRFWRPAWHNEDLDAVLDAIRRDGGDAGARLLAAATPGLPAHRLGVLWYALQRIGAGVSLDRFLQQCGKARLERPAVRTRQIPAGRFVMGGADEGAYADELPPHEVEVSAPYRLATTPVTLAGFRMFDPRHDNYRRTEPTMPAVGVDWFAARLFAAWLGGRLPSEAEWEHACRAGTETAYWSGNNPDDLERVGWFDGNSGIELHPVGQNPANPWGLHDMHGNVWEWCDDRFGDYGAPKTADPAGPARGPGRVLRGGSAFDGPHRCRSAARGRVHPASRSDGFGFQVVLVAPPPAGP